MTIGHDLLRRIVYEQSQDLIVSSSMVIRDVWSEVERFAKTPQVVVVTGLRRVGKSTLLKQMIARWYPEQAYYLSFEDERLLNFTIEDFDVLYEIFVEYFGDCKVFFLDEVQNVPQWELFVRRMHDRGFKFYVTGSNAALLSKELGTRLTGRCVYLVLYPFSFLEFLKFKKIEVSKNFLFDTKNNGLIKKEFNDYLIEGGIPLYLMTKEKIILKQIYEDILYRDIVSRYKIQDLKALRELAFFLMSNASRSITLSKLRQFLQLGSINTVKNYLHFLENGFLIFIVERFSFSIKTQALSPKKIYIIDNGLMGSVAFQFSENKGQYLENLVFLSLKKSGYDIFYYKTENNLEVDFVVRKDAKIVMLIQVSYEIEEPKVFERELKALKAGMKELGVLKGLILTLDTDKNLKEEGVEIKSMVSWLCLNNQDA